jgi:2-polyprenyl-6-methoxyphenol hydroxylase-like FAD-dependent oxidoreductase
MGSGTTAPLDVLVVGAGPTGLTLAAQLARFGVHCRVIDKQLNRAHESRALGVQARTLEILETLGLGETLVRRGSNTTRLKLHVDRGEPASLDLGQVPRSDTRFPFILFVGQPQTEGVLAEYLSTLGVVIERGVELTTAHEEHGHVACALRHGDGRQESIVARYVAGCDGAHSTVRKAAGIDFEGAAYPQNFVLGDVEADNLERGAIHAFAAGRGVAMFFPLGDPTTWRVMAIESSRPQPPTVSGHRHVVSTQPLSLAELQAMIEEPTVGSVRVRDAAWLTRFRLHHRQASRYREGRMFLAGDAAHIHSPVGAQGMNTGIQDAWNLGWKLALVVDGRADPRLLDSYHAERWPVGRTLLRATDRLFGGLVQTISGSLVMSSIRRLAVRHLVAPALSRPRIRAAAFHFVSQLGIRYRSSPAITEGQPRLLSGPRAGDRLPDAPLDHEGRLTYLQQAVASPHLHLLLCGCRSAWRVEQLDDLEQRFANLLVVKAVGHADDGTPLVDVTGQALRQLGVQDHAQYIVRPDGHIAFRCAGTDLSAATAYLETWFKPDRSRRAT